MSTRATHITLHFVFVFLLALLCFTLSGNSAAASPAAQEESGGYAIVITQTVGLDPAVCADSSSITAAYNQAVYPCVTVHNTGSLTLTRHTLHDSHLGVHTFDALLPPGAMLNTVEQGLDLSARFSVTTTHVVTWTAQPFGYEEATATASATVYVTPHPGRITVNTTEDAINHNGDCSLREAIIAANTGRPVDGCASGQDTSVVFVPAGTYRLVLGDNPPDYRLFAPPEDASATGDLDLLTDIVIQGEGAESTVIEGLRHDRVFHILPGATVTLADLTIQGGHNTDAGGGGGIRNEGNLTLQDSLVSGNCACDETGYTDSYSGGGIWNNGTLTITRSEISSNQAGSSYAGSYWYFSSGGGIYNLGTLTMTESLVRHNSGGDGGGLINLGVASIANSRIASNRSYGEGAGITNLRELVVYDTDIAGNIANCDYPASCVGGGGGLFNGGTATVERSRIGYNSAYNSVDNWGSGEGGGIRNIGTITLSQTVVYSNTAQGRQPTGGGIANMGRGLAFIYNSTISGNTAQGESQANSRPHGGGIYNQSQMDVQDSTIAHNQLTCPRVTCREGTGGGIANEDSGTITLTNSLVAGNSVEANATAPDCGGVITSGGALLVGDSSGCTLTGETSGNLTDVDAQIAPLAESPGHDGTITWIHALRPGSPAIDAGSACSAVDQRGVSRPQDGTGDGTAACDIGAYELCTDANDPRCVALPDGTTTGAGDPAESDDPTAQPHHLHLPLLQSDAGG